MLSTGVLRMMLFIMVWSIQGVGGKPMCDPEDNKYYHTQADMCLQCEHCLQGEEAISLQVHIFIWTFEAACVKLIGLLQKYFLKGIVI